MELLVIGDCHGEVPDIGGVDGYELVLVVGDVCATQDELRDAIEEAGRRGTGWYEVVGEDRAQEILEGSLEQGRKVMRWLDSLDTPVYIVPGNADWTGVVSDWPRLQGDRYSELVDKFDSITDLNFRRFEFGGYSFIGYGPCPGPEFGEVYRDSLERLEKLFREAGEKTVLLSHNVPHDTPLDRSGDGENYGSRVVRRIIENHSPVLSVAGHMHDNQGSHRIGDTLCINAGLNSYAEIEIEGGEVGFGFG